MKPLPHVYGVRLSGAAAGYATLSAEGVPDLRSAPPADFDGPGDAWSPEHLLLAAVETCFLFTLRSIAQASKLEFSRCEVAAEGTIDRKDGVTRFTEIVMRPRLSISSSANIDRARRIIEKSEKACLVFASLSTPIRLEPQIAIDG